jgi:isopentenyldiphosphate isomerase
MPKESISVWLRVEDGEHAGSFVLQQRSEKSEHFPLICQATWAGKADEGETAEHALPRDCREELGSDFADTFDITSLLLFATTHYEMQGEPYICYNYIGSVGVAILGKAHLHDEAQPVFIFAKPDSPVFDINSKQDPKDHIVLFNDQLTIFNAIRGNN